VTGRAPRVFAGALLLALAAPLAAHEPIPIRDQNPLIRGLYLPVPGDVPAATGTLVQRLALTLTNSTNVEVSNGETLRADGESLELRWLLAWQPLERLQLRAAVPVVSYSGGALDGLVEEWHDLLGVSGGWRGRVPDDDLMYYYVSPDGMMLETDSRTALGDIALEAGLSLRETGRARLSAWLGVEAPTGDDKSLTGNEAWDFGAWLEGGVELKGVGIDGRLGVVRPGSANPLPLEARDWIAFGSIGASWELTPALALRLQVDAHDGMLEDSGLRFLGEVLQLTIGAQYRSPGGWRWQLALAEDVLVDSAPDFAIQLGVQIGGGAR
jgi:hypothetical protein